MSKVNVNNYVLDVTNIDDNKQANPQVLRDIRRLSFESVEGKSSIFKMISNG